MRTTALVAVAALVLASSATAADPVLTVVSQTATTITFAYPAVAVADGYRYYADGVAVARTFDPSRLTVRFAKASSYKVTALHVAEGATAGVYPALPSPPPPPSGETLTVDGSWTCAGRVDYALVKVTNHGQGDAVRLASGCTGRVGRLEVSGVRNGDAIKVQNSGSVAHDLTVESGFASCAGPSTDGTHQDGIQAMGGTNITFQHFVFDCYGGGGGNFFVQRAGGGATTPTAIVCEGCALGPRHPNNVNLGTSVGSGVRDSLLCRPTSGRNPFATDTGAQAVVNDGNQVVASNDPRCATLQTLISAT